METMHGSLSVNIHELPKLLTCVFTAGLCFPLYYMKENAEIKSDKFTGKISFPTLSNAESVFSCCNCCPDLNFTDSDGSSWKITHIPLKCCESSNHARKFGEFSMPVSNYNYQTKAEYSGNLKKFSRGALDSLASSTIMECTFPQNSSNWIKFSLLCGAILVDMLYFEYL
jgi:hypothetical protein